MRGIVRDGERRAAAGQGEVVEVVLDRTTFYAESGGQIADEGTITSATGATLRVLDVQRPVKGLIVHKADVIEGEIAEGDQVQAAVDPQWRTSARQAHSGTHIVHAALRQVLGPSALQSGSYNRPGYLRLDFAWGTALDARAKQDIEDVANQALRRDLPVDVRYMPLAEAREIGALALFGETYDETVRVVVIGGAWSRELCGGTHVAHSSQVGAVTLIGESSVGSGVRRLEAYTGFEAMQYLARERALVMQLSDTLRAPADELPDRVAALLERVRMAEKEVERLRAGELLAVAPELAAQAETVGDAGRHPRGRRRLGGTGSAPVGHRGARPAARGPAGGGGAGQRRRGRRAVRRRGERAGQAAGLRWRASSRRSHRPWARAAAAKADLAQGAGGIRENLVAAFGAARESVAQR